jgi:hypothetical protein
MRSPWRLALAPLVAAACGPTSFPSDDDGGRTPDGAPPGCTGLACYQTPCSGGGSTTLSGTVYAPNGTLALYNASVYVPNAPIDAFPTGVGCDRCSSGLSGNPLTSTTTDTNGRFVLSNVPAAPEVPVVIQIGRWRRVTTLTNVTACADTPLDPEQTRLPRNQGEGDIPQMALSTGGWDALECLLRKIGLDDDEFTTDSAGGRVHLYAGVAGTDQLASGPALSPSTALWASSASLGRYDVVFLACEGDQHSETKQAPAPQALSDYAGVGGRVFASHYHNYWIQNGPGMWPLTTTFEDLNDLGTIVADVDMSYPRGRDLADWLVNVQASATLGRIAIDEAQHTVTSVDDTLAQRQIYLDVTGNLRPSVQYLGFTTPLEAQEEARCGRVVFSDIHVAAGDVSNVDRAFPSGCTSTGLSPQEKVLAFMIFDIASCIGVD